MATNVIIQQPQIAPLIAVQSNQWSTGICDCFDDLCVLCAGYWCFPCFACKTASDFGECFCLPLLDFCWSCIALIGGMSPCVPPIAMAMRIGVRNRYGIQGDMCSDCIYATFCNSCSWCQVAREIKRRTQPLTIINAQPTVFAAAPTVIAPQPAVIAPQPAVIAPQPAVIAPQSAFMSTQSTVIAPQPAVMPQSTVMSTQSTMMTTRFP
ncbi:cornifelin homolog A-like [Megalops cyprinoides]|uniref:cornifelin homolog A-like n=1 Tax=Megalops cyprinoides TaxID=118141 RepID=UPI001863CAE4|nr:cornifelin homolog A-like [Megalops cyprinoides]